MKDLKKFGKELIRKSKYSKFQDFHNLMRFRIQDILLVSSLYDSYVFEEDGRLYELIRQEYQGLNLSHSPELVQSSSGEEAITLLKKENRFNLIVVTQHVKDMSSIAFAKKVKEEKIDIPIILLGYDNLQMHELIKHEDVDVFDKVFIWQGDYRVLIGIIKFIEDRLNIEYDTQKVGVQVIILVEDNIRFYSSYLPLIYTELLKQSQSLISEGINLSHKFLRMRARPKIILCSSYEEAWDYYEKYDQYVLGIISDVDFIKDGKQDPSAGIEFANKVKSRQPDIPILLQSFVQNNEKAAKKLGAGFLLKNSPRLLHDLSNYMKENFGFGDFIFRNEKGKEVDRAVNLVELEEKLKIIPDESILFHASRNHFSNWLKARTEFWLAHILRPKKVSDFDSTEKLRELLINTIKEFRRSRQVGVILDFNKNTFDKTLTFARIGGGSIGGKARGLGFVNNLLSNFNIRQNFKDIDIYVPASVVVGTDVFDYFLDENNLRDFALRAENDEKLLERFLAANDFPDDVLQDLFDFLKLNDGPLAVRSSSLLEDSQDQPFAGVYETYMIPNIHRDVSTRLYQLLSVMKRIYASIFSQKAKNYIKVTSYRLEEEKMAVIIQKMVGAQHGTRFYPEFSGVAKSYNFYPSEPLKPEDGIVSTALGLGEIITDGGNAIRFCPKYPQHLLQYANLDDTIKYSQQTFYSLNLKEWDNKTSLTQELLINEEPISEAEKDGTLSYVASTYSAENDALYDGISRSGVRLFTLSPILKHKYFPLPGIINLLLELGSWGMGSPVEIEFAVNLSVPQGKPKEFGLLQMRPLVIANEVEELDIRLHSNKELICKSEKALGNGVVKDIYDIIYINNENFDRSKSLEVAHEISVLNAKLLSQNKKYLLIGVGRWGTLDPWLGIPVTWEQISGAKAIVESNFKDFNVTPSQGSHFFQNLTSFKVGYFTVNDFKNQGFIDWDWLNVQNIIEETLYARHIRLKDPVTIKINGRQNKGIIIKPSKNQH
ncbi:PEP/pyruvate-binding domain-containing protein [Bacteroidota bacterium]